MQDYTRYRAPILALRGLADFNSSGHPLAAVRRHMAPGRSKLGKDRLVHAIKLYGATFTQALEDERLRLLQELGGSTSATSAGGDPAGNGARLGAYLGTIRRNLDGFRALREELGGPAQDARVAATLDGIDEYLSLEVEEKLLDLLLALEREERIDGQYRERIREAVGEETAYRGRQGYPSHVAPARDDAANEAYSYRHGVLKKVAASSLFMVVRPSKAAKRAMEIVAAVSAGLAMLFAVAVAVASARKMNWGLYSTQWIVVAVVAYMFKDRIKEWCRKLGYNQLTRFLSDRRTVLRDPDGGQSIGAINETAHYVSEDKVPNDVLALRSSSPFSLLELEHAEEYVLRYARDISLTRVGRGNGTGLVNDILRYDFGRFLRRMDDPREPVAVLARNGGVDHVPAPRVYHVYLVLCLRDLSGRSGPPLRQAFCVVLTREGIRRLEAGCG
jgi:hypothetical protein